MTNIIPYTEDHKTFRQRLQEFLSIKVMPFTCQWEKKAIIPRAIWNEIGGEGLLCPTMPEKYGGIGGDYLYSVILAEELAKTNQWGLAANHHSDITKHYIEQYAAEELKEKYLPKCLSGEIVTAMATTEPDCGSDLLDIKTNAVEQDDHIVINGSKAFISNGYWSDLIVLFVQEDSEQTNQKDLSLLLVPADTPGFKRGKPFKKLGWRSQDTTELFFDNCRIPKQNRIGKKGSGLSIFMENIQSERLIMSIQAIVLAELIYGKTFEYCKKGSENRSSLFLSQSDKFALVDIAADLKIGRTFIDHLILENLKGSNILTEITMSKFWATEMCGRAISKCLDIMGDSAIEEDAPVSRAFRDARVLRIAGGSTETLKDATAELIGLKDVKSAEWLGEADNYKSETDLHESDEFGNTIIIELKNMISKIIGKDNIKINDKFINLGMDSILTVRLLWQIREQYNIDELTVADVFQATSIKKLAPIIEEHLSCEKQSEFIIPQIVGNR